MGTKAAPERPSAKNTNQTSRFLHGNRKKEVAVSARQGLRQCRDSEILVKLCRKITEIRAKETKLVKLHKKQDESLAKATLVCELEGKTISETENFRMNDEKYGMRD